MHLFDSNQAYMWKQKQDLTREDLKFHFFKVPKEETVVGFYGRTGANCFKSIGLIVFRPGEAEVQKIDLKLDKNPKSNPKS